MTNQEFWKYIKELEWDGDYDKCSNLLREINERDENFNLVSFYLKFNKIWAEINKETTQRIDSGKGSFEQYVSYGQDDCHFMDLPCELIGRGR